MANETENIEAKLAAYVDGELAEADRAEIETYLDANPQHRALIESLRQDRAALRGLPHESAPADIAESLHGQLERSALLGSGGDASYYDSAQSRMRIYRLPQITAVAAMIILAVGLGFVVYLALPPSRPAGFSIAPSKVTPPLEDGAAAMDMDVAVARKPAAEAGVEMKKSGEDDVFARGGAAANKGAPVAGKLALGAVSSDELSQKQIAVNSINGGNVGNAGNAMFQNSQTQSRLGGTSRSQALTVVVNTDNPAATETQLKNYFASNNITWEATAEPMPEPLKLGNSQVVEASRFNMTQVRLAPKAQPAESDFTLSATLPTAGQHPQQQEQQQQESLTLVAAAPPKAPAPAAAAAPDASGTASGLSDDRAAATVALEPRPVTLPTKGWFNEPAGAVADSKRVAAANAEPVTEGTTAATPTPVAPSPPPLLTRADHNFDFQGPVPGAATTQLNAGALAVNNTYIARGLTRRQASELTNSLSNTRSGQSVQFWDTDGGTQSYGRQTITMGAKLETLADAEKDKSLAGVSGVTGVTPAPAPESTARSEDISVKQQLQGEEQKVAPLAEQAPSTRATGGGYYAVAEQQELSKKESVEKRGFEVSKRDSIESASALATTAAPAAPAARPASAPASKPISTLHRSDNLLITLGDPSVEGNVHRAKVADDGAINLPTVGSVKAAGKSEAELEDSIADQYRVAKLDVPGSIRVRNLGEAGDVSQLSQIEKENQQLFQQSRELRQQLAEQRGAQPATQGATQTTTDAAGEIVDLVVVLRNNDDQTKTGAGASSTTTPTTRP